MKPPTYAGAPYDEEKDKDAIKAALQRLDDRDRFMIQFTTLLLIPNISNIYAGCSVNKILYIMTKPYGFGNKI